MPEPCEIRGCLGTDAEAVLVDGERRLFCSYDQDFWREAGYTVTKE